MQEARRQLDPLLLALDMDIPPANVPLAEDGDVVELSEKGLDFVGSAPPGYLYVDGIVGDVSHGVLRDRRVLPDEGVILAAVVVDASSGAIISGPAIITTGVAERTRRRPMMVPVVMEA